MTIDFQSEGKRWAAEIACAEANAINPHARWIISDVTTGNGSIYALALRILRTETRPDPLYDALFEVVEMGRYDTREQTNLLRDALKRRGFEIAVLKESGV